MMCCYRKTIHLLSASLSELVSDHPTNHELLSFKSTRHLFLVLAHVHPTALQSLSHNALPHSFHPLHRTKLRDNMSMCVLFIVSTNHELKTTSQETVQVYCSLQRYTQAWMLGKDKRVTVSKYFTEGKTKPVHKVRTVQLQLILLKKK